MHQSSSSSSILPTSLLISTHPIHALRLTTSKNHQQTNLDSNSNLIYSKPIPTSKRPNRSIKPSTHSPTSNSSNSSLGSEKHNSFRTDSIFYSSEPLSPALPHLPPTPLTPHEIIHSPTLSRLFGRSNTVFTQLAASATGLIQTDLNIGHSLTQLNQLLRGDINSTTSFQLIQKSNQDQLLQNSKNDVTLSQHQRLIQSLPTLQSLFITTSHQVNIDIQPSSSNQNQQQQHHPTLSSLGQDTKSMDVEEQNESFQICLIQINKFLGDLRDYRERLMELRDGCLGIEKRRRAMWYLIKVCSVGFDQLLTSTHQDQQLTNLNDPQQQITSPKLIIGRKRKNDQQAAASDSDSDLLPHSKKKSDDEESSLEFKPSRNRHPTPNSTINQQKNKKNQKKNQTSRSIHNQQSSSTNRLINNLPSVLTTFNSKLDPNTDQHPIPILSSSPNSHSSYSSDQNQISKKNSSKTSRPITSLDPVLHHPLPSSNHHHPKQTLNHPTLPPHQSFSNPPLDHATSTTTHLFHSTNNKSSKRI